MVSVDQRSPPVVSAPTGPARGRALQAAPTGGRLRRPVTLLIALATLGIPVTTAGAATTDQIIRDARDGQVDGLYHASDLRAALASPLLKTYGGTNGVEAVKGALGSQTESEAGAGTLPFTGAELATFALLGSGLLVAGFVLRRENRSYHVHDDR